MSYFDTIESMIKNENVYNWDYYHCHSGCKTVGDVFGSPRSFVNNTFVYAKKQLLLSTNHNDRYSFEGPNISVARAAHSISSFFTGMILAQGLFEDNLNSFCHLYGTENGVFPFSYVWNLTCLYHDFGYEFENDTHSCQIVKEEMDRLSDRMSAKNRPLEACGFQGHSLFAVSKMFSIKTSYLPVGRYDLFDKEDSAETRFILRYIHDKKNSMLCNGAPVKIPHRSALQVERYLNYRLYGRKSSCLDHGIMGGLSFFDLIIDNYIKEYKENRGIGKNQDFTNFQVTNLLDNPLRVIIEQTVLFAYIADCIMNHNIWKCQKGSESDYKKFKLNALMGCKFEKVDFYKNPLLFVLVMADCLEPYKNYCKAYFDHGIDEQEYDKNEALSIFKDYGLTVDSGKIVITVPDSCITACESKLNDMQDWISLEYEKRVNRFYIIPIQQK